MAIQQSRKKSTIPLGLNFLLQNSYQPIHSLDTFLLINFFLDLPITCLQKKDKHCHCDVLLTQLIRYLVTK